MSFTVDLTRIVNKTKATTEIATKKVILELFTKIIMKTPVDTGALRWNWMPSLGSYSSQTVDGTDEGAASAARAAAFVAASKLGQYYYLVNNMPYARRIEYEGWSKVQAPQGMLRISIAEIQARYGT